MWERGESRIVVSADLVGPPRMLPRCPRIVGILGRRSSFWILQLRQTHHVNAECGIGEKSDTKITMSQRLLNIISKFSFFNVYNLPVAISYSMLLTMLL